MANTLDTRRVQLDRLSDRLRGLIPPKPKKGWIHEIRSALQMNSRQLAKRMGLNQSSVSRLESSEASNSITLESLNRAADALGCDLHYILIPRESLRDTVYKQAKKVVDRDYSQVAHTMALEDQHAESIERDIRIAYCMLTKGTKIWDEE